MNFIQVDIYTKSQAVSVLTMRLSELGITGFVIHDSADFNEFLENKSANWDYVDDELMGLKTTPTYITAYLPDDSQGTEMLTVVKGVLNELKQNDSADFYGELKAVLANVREEDWENNWKQYYKPFAIGERLLIKPSWETVEANGRTVLEIDPASTFGTGQHHTTRLCLEKLESCVKGGEKVLDLGCGSGILAISDMLLGAEKAVMVDVFENAARTSAENAAKNNIPAGKCYSYCGNIIDDEALRDKIGTGYDIITANIVADVIIAMSGIVSSFMKKDALLIVSGIITERLDEVRAALTSAGFDIKAVTEREGWNRIDCAR